MRTNPGLAWNGVDVVLLVGMAVFGPAAFFTLFPGAWDWCYLVLLDVPYWPFWVWTCLGVVVLTVLIGVRARSGRE